MYVSGDSLLAYFVLEFSLEGVDFGGVDDARWDVDELVFRYHGLVALVKFVENGDRLVAVLVRVLNDGSDNIAVFDALQRGGVLVEGHDFYFAEFAGTF